MYYNIAGGLGSGLSGVELLLSMCMALGSIPSTTKKKEHCRVSIRASQVLACLQYAVHLCSQNGVICLVHISLWLFPSVIVPPIKWYHFLLYVFVEALTSIVRAVFFWHSSLLPVDTDMFFFSLKAHTVGAKHNFISYIILFSATMFHNYLPHIKDTHSPRIQVSWPWELCLMFTMRCKYK